MSADIKTVLTDERIASITASIYGSYSHIASRQAYKMARAIERAVLEAAPASSAMAIAIDCLNKISEFCPHDSSVDQLDDSPEMQRRLHDAEIGDTARSAIAALQPQQSPVQASDAGRQG